MESTQTHIDVFISRKSADAPLANELYRYLLSKGLSVFESDESLPKLGSSDYRKQIDKALDECNHMIVIGSSIENISSSWVEAEWGFYIGEKRAGRKNGNILTVITDDIEIKDLPASLRYYEVIYFEKENFDRIAAYAGKEYVDTRFKSPKKKLLRSKWLLPAASVICLFILFAYFMSEQNKPFDATLFVQPSADIKLNSSYPLFEGGELSLWLDNKEEKKTLLAGEEVVFKQLPVLFRNKKVAARLTARNWKLQRDTIELNKTVHIAIVPDESLATIYGNVKDNKGNGIGSCSIIIDNNDTIVFTNSNGFFKIQLPYSMQKAQYLLNINKEGYQPLKESYFARSGNIDIELKK